MRSWITIAALGSIVLRAGLTMSSQDVTTIPLRVKDVVAVEQDFGMLIVQVPVKCDGRGNIYFRRYQREFEASPVVRVSEDGKQEAEFSIRAAPGFEQGRTDDLAVGLGGEVYVLGAKEIGKSHIVKFTPDGDYDSSFELEPVLDARHLAAFPTGEFLIVGELLSEYDRKPTGKPLLALYDRSGSFVREISLPRDVEELTVQTAGQSQAYDLSLTHVTSAEDGNIYLMRRIASPIIYVISSAGTVLRRLTVPAPGEDFEPETMKVSGGRVVVQFRKKGSDGRTSDEIFSVVDAHTGDKVTDYSSTADAGGAWACYTPEGFTFLGIAKGEPYRLTLVHAVPR